MSNLADPASWPDEVRRRFQRVADVLADVGVKLPPTMTIEQWSKAHQVTKATFWNRKKRGQTPPLVAEGKQRRGIPIESWIAFDIQQRLWEEARAAATRPFQPILDEVAAKPLEPDVAERLEKALAALHPELTNILSAEGKRDLLALAWAENNVPLTQDQLRQLRQAQSAVVHAEVARYQKEREGGGA